jgi:hypothetical protein
MQVYHQGIVITKLQEIQDRYRNHMPDVESGETEIIDFDKESEDAQWITQNILPDIEAYTGKKHTFHRAVLFGQGPKSFQPEHIDGFWPPKDNAIIWSLNIPITNCEQGEMIWYEGDFTVSPKLNSPEYDSGFKPSYRTNVKLLNSLDLTWVGERKIKDRIVVNQPTIVKVDLPHQVVNASNQVRKLLAVRVSPNLIMQQ